MERSRIDLKRLKSTIEKVLDTNHANLKESLSGALDDFCSRMFQEGIVSSTVRDKGCFNQVMKEYKASMLFMKSEVDFRKHCFSLIIVLQAVGGPASTAAGVLEREWTESVRQEMNFIFTIIPPPQQSNDDTGMSHTNLKKMYASYHPLCIPSNVKQVHINPPVVPNSSTKIWQFMKHDPDFRHKILDQINENVVTKKGQTSETLPKMWERQVESQMQKVPLSPALHDYSYDMEYQESDDRRRSVWLMPGKSRTSPNHRAQEVPVHSRDGTMRHWLTDPCFMNHSDDQHLVIDHNDFEFSNSQKPVFNVHDSDTTPISTSYPQAPLLNEQIAEPASSDTHEQVSKSISVEKEESSMAVDNMIHSLRVENTQLKQRMSKIENQVDYLLKRTEQYNHQSSDENFVDARIKADYVDELKQKDLEIVSLQARLNEKQAQVNEHRVMCVLVLLIVAIVFSVFFSNTFNSKNSSKSPHTSETS